MLGNTYLSPAKFKIFAHRGTTELGATENTIQAFTDAISCGADYLETDVQVTKDGHAVIFHDDDLSRIFGVDQRISVLTLAELKELATSLGVGLPSLEEALTALPTSRFNIDIKALDAAEPAARVVNQLGANNRVLVSSFGAKRRRVALKLLPHVATSADASRVILLVLGLILRSKNLVSRALTGLNAVQIPTQLGLIKLDGKRLIDTCHAYGVEVHYWTINEPAEAKRLKGLGADGIVTDRCKLMVIELAE